MQLLIDLRNNLRAEAKRIAAKDDPVEEGAVRPDRPDPQALADLGVMLEDRPGGTTWRLG